MQFNPPGSDVAARGTHSTALLSWRASCASRATPEACPKALRALDRPVQPSQCPCVDAGRTPRVGQAETPCGKRSKQRVTSSPPPIGVFCRQSSNTSWTVSWNTNSSHYRNFSLKGKVIKMSYFPLFSILRLLFSDLFMMLVLTVLQPCPLRLVFPGSEQWHLIAITVSGVRVSQPGRHHWRLARSWFSVVMLSWLCCVDGETHTLVTTWKRSIKLSFNKTLSLSLCNDW